MAWGGSLNKEGSDYLRYIRKADDVIEFLDKLKEKLHDEEILEINRVIEIITKVVSKLSEKKK